MGLSRRRRAKKDVRKVLTNQDENPHQQTHESADRRTGNTYRRVFPRSVRERMHANLLSLSSHENRSSVNSPTAIPRSQPQGAGSDVQPNANLCNPDSVHVRGNDYSKQVIYSLNKHGRWEFPEQLKAAYDEDEDLDTNLFLIETVAQNCGYRANGSVRCVTSNASYMMHAADELRNHCRTSAKPKVKRQSKQLVAQNDGFEFSDRVRQEMTSRHLTQLKAKASGGSINAKSIQHSCTNLKGVNNLLPTAELARASLQADYDARTQIIVTTCVPSPHFDANRCRHAEIENYTERRYGHPLKDFPYHCTKVLQRMVKRARKSELDIQFELDGNKIDEYDYLFIDEDEQTLPCHRPKEATIMDAMRPKSEVSANRAKKLAIKAQSMRKARTNSGLIAETSGYNSDLEISDADGDESERTVNQKLADAIHATLTEERPTVQVAREFTDDLHVTNMFGPDCSGSVMMSNSVPRKLAFLLQPDLSESVVFEEAAAQDPASVTYTVHHSCCADQTPKTSAKEVASHLNPFAFLRSLVHTAPEMSPIEKTRLSDTASFGWRRAHVLAETDARVTAIRALPMFTVAAADDSSKAVLVPSVECEICCQQMDMDLKEDPKSFAEGSTMLIECGHHFCNKCWLQHVASSVSQGRVGVTCPGHRCRSVVDAATMLWFCPSKLLSALTSAAFRAWLTARKSGVQRRFCPQKNCGRLLECHSGVNAVCGACGGGICLDCGQDPHWPADCNTAARYKNKMQQLGHLKLSISDVQAESHVSAKKCPTCHLIMEKGPGCNYMYCPCGVPFCWWCGLTIKSHNMGGACNGSRNLLRRPASYFFKDVFRAHDQLYLVPSGTQSRLYCKAVNIRIQTMTVQLQFRLIKNRLADLFASYAYEFASGSGNGSDLNSAEGARTAQQMTATVMQASHLVEYSYALLDHLPRDRWRFKRAVQEVGNVIRRLVDDMVSEVQLLHHGRHCATKRTRLVCQRLLMLLDNTQSRCRLLYALVVYHRMSSSSYL